MRSTGPASAPDMSSRNTSLWGPPWYGGRPLEALRPAGVPWVTLALGGVQLALFLAGRQWWSGPGSLVLLYRLGAVWGPLGSEAWRLVSAGFVSQDRTHLGLHLAALLVGGLYVEGLLGSGRMMLLYVASLVLSQAVHLGCFPEALGMGAAGGLCGLGGALAVLARQPRVPLERPGRLATGVAAVGVLGLAVASEWGSGLASVGAACLPGLAVGVGLAGTRVLTWRVPLYVWRHPRCWRLHEPLPVLLVAWAVAVLTGGGLALALQHGRPWELHAEQTLERRSVPGTSVSVAVPMGAVAGPESLSRDGESVTVVYGEPRRDPLVMTVSARRLERAVPEARLEAETQALRDELRLSEREPPPTEDLVLWTAPSVEQLKTGPAVFSSREAGPGFWSSRWVMYRGRWRISLELRFEREATEAWAELVDQLGRNVDVYEP